MEEGSVEAWPEEAVVEAAPHHAAMEAATHHAAMKAATTHTLCHGWRGRQCYESCRSENDPCD